MSVSYLIHNYIDEGLSGAQEEALFSELATDSKLREEFNRQMKIHIIAGKDMNSLAPPAELSAAIFGKLGFAASVPNQVSTDVAGAKPKSGAMSRYAIIALIALLSSFLSVGVYWSVDNNIFSGKSGDLSSSTSLQNSEIGTNAPMAFSYSTSDDFGDNSLIARSVDLYDIENGTTSSSSNRGNIHSSTTFGKSGSSFSRGNSRQSADRNILSNASTQSDLSADMNKSGFSEELDNNLSNTSSRNLLQNYTAVSRIETEKLTSMNNSNLINSKFSNSFGGINPSFVSIDLLNPDNLFIDNTTYEISIIRNTYNSNPDLGSLNTVNGVFDDIAVSGRYKIDKYHSLGVEISREHFGQIFNTNVAGLEVTQRQNPLLIAVSPFYRLTLPKISFLAPYLQAGIGATTIGPVGKIQIGTDLQVFKSIKANISFNSGTLIYNVDDKLYNSSKYGFSYGFSYGF